MAELLLIDRCIVSGFFGFFKINILGENKSGFTLVE